MIAEGEITDAESLKRLDDLEADMVFNCAASVKHFSAGSDIYDTNVLGVQNVLEFATRHGARMIHISTTSTAGEILLASNATADHDRDRADRLFSTAMTALLIFGLLFAALGTAFRGALVAFLCRDESLRGDVAEYCSVLVLGIPLLCYIMSLSYFARSDGSPRLSFQAVLISNLINLTMDIVLMKGFNMGLRGAALATVIGYVGGSAWISRYLASKHRQLRVVSPFGAGIAVFLKETWAICVRGFPTASSQL